MRAGLDSGDVDHRSAGGLDRDAILALGDPALQATVSDLEYAHTVLVLGTEPVDDAPVLDLRLRKGARKHRMKIAVATERPSTLDPTAKASLRYAPGGGAALVVALAAAFFGGDLDGPAAAAGADPDGLRDIAGLLRTGGEDVVILYGERLLAGGPDVVGALLKLAGALGMAGRPGAGLLGIPSGTNARGLREAACSPTRARAWPRPRPGRDAAGIAARPRPATSTRSTCSRRIPARPAPPRAVAAGPGQGHARHRPRRASCPRASAITRRSSSPRSPTRRRRGRSPTPTAACSACARRSAARA
jgi:NADH-quinone oxidoreductase subunit G